MTKHKMAIAALAAALLAAGTGLSSAESFEPNHADNLKDSEFQIGPNISDQRSS